MQCLHPEIRLCHLKLGVGGLCSVPGNAEHWCITPNYADLLPQLIFGGCTLPRGSSAGAASPTAMPPLSRKRQDSEAGAAKEVRGDRGMRVPGGVTQIHAWHGVRVRVGDMGCAVVGCGGPGMHVDTG